MLGRRKVGVLERGRRAVGLCAALAALLAGTGAWLAVGPVAGAVAVRSSLPLADPTGSAGSWGSAKEVPGTAKLNADGDAGVYSVSCASAGSCAAGGQYNDGAGHYQVFVVDEVNGRWGSAKEVPGTAALNAGGDAQINSVSCASAGNCAAGGYYRDGSSDYQAFVVNEVNGTWRSAEEVPATATLNARGDAQIDSLSCPSAGNCAAGGYYRDGSNHQQAFVVDEVNGTWGSAKEVPATATLNAGGSAAVESVSCPSAGKCTAGGEYQDASNHDQAFVVRQMNGTWGSAKEVPGMATLNVGGVAVLVSLSCPSAGNCAAGGFYKDGTSHLQAFVVDEVNGTWGSAKEVPGTATLNAGGEAQVNSLSCPAAGNCAAGGFYIDGSGHYQAFVVNEVKGSWGTAKEVPGTATLNAGGRAVLVSLSCASAGNCAAGGYYTDSSTKGQAFVAREVNGAWGSAKEVPGTATLNAGGVATVNSLSCASAGNCAAGGYYRDVPGNSQAFVVDFTPAPSITALSPRTGPTSGGTLVTITGKQLLAPTAVLFGTKKARIHRVLSATKIEVISPKGSGTVAVRVSTPGGTSAKTAADRYTYVPLPIVRRLSPSKGPTSGGTLVTITGKHLLAPTAVHFGAKKARIHRVLSATKIEVISPKGSGTVAVRVSTPGGTSAKTAAARFKYLRG